MVASGIGRACVGTASEKTVRRPRNNETKKRKGKRHAASFCRFFASVPLDGIENKEQEGAFQIACFSLCCALASPEAYPILLFSLFCSFGPFVCPTFDPLSSAFCFHLLCLIDFFSMSPPTVFLLCQPASRGAIGRRGFLRVAERSGAAPIRTGEGSWDRVKEGSKAAKQQKVEPTKRARARAGTVKRGQGRKELSSTMGKAAIGSIAGD